jgi:hypothetical protein
MEIIYRLNISKRTHTPGLDLEGHQGLGGGLGALSGLLGLVLLETLVALSNNGGILLLRVGAEEVLLLLVLLGLVLGVDGELGGLGAVGSEGLGGVTGEGGELALVRGDVLVPAGNVGELGSVGTGAEGLEGHNIGLAGGVAVENSQFWMFIESNFMKGQIVKVAAKFRNAIARNWM